MLAREAGAREMQGKWPCSLSTFPYIWGSHTAVGPDELEKNLEAGGLQKPRPNVQCVPWIPILCPSERGRLQIIQKKELLAAKLGRW